MIGTHGWLWRRVHIVVYVCCAVWGVCCTALHAAQKSAAHIGPHLAAERFGVRCCGCTSCSHARAVGKPAGDGLSAHTTLGRRRSVDLLTLR
jgi:hypothetical protein